MIFNLNEQKVLSDPSGSSVFKGEKDFNDIVVNLPDNIDGHTATELNYVMHFVDSDGGYSTKILTVDSSGEALKATATVSTSITSKAQAFYAYVLMTDDEETVIGKTNGVIVMIHPVPDEENEIIPPADADKIIKGLEEIVKEATDTIEEATEAISSKQDKLTAGENITITEENVISASSGSNDYTDLTNKPSINNVTLSGNKTSDDLSLQSKLTAGNNITINNGVISASGGVTSYEDLTDKPRVADANFNYFDIDKTLYFPDFDISLQGLLKQFSLKPLNSGKLENGDGYYVRETYKSTFNLNTPTLDMYGKWFYFDATNAIGLPSGIDVVTTRYENQNKKIMMYSCRACQIYDVVTNIDLPLLQEIYWTDSTLKNHYAIRTYIKKTDGTRLFTDWLELGSGGAQIVSGVVNANGTITFTDSDGNTFTTTGSSVIGADGFSPVATVTQTASGATVSITDKNGTTTASIANGQDGNDYVLTAQDKSDIADIVLSELPTTQGVLYGNTSN